MKKLINQTYNIPSPVLLSAMVMLLALLTSCGGGTDSTATAESADGTKQALAVSGTTAVPPGWTGRAPKYEVINGITVPPEPPAAANNATLKGVDVNANGIRDDIERKIAANVPLELSGALLYANLVQKIVEGAKLSEQEQDSAFCASVKGGFNSDEITIDTINNANRLQSYFVKRIIREVPSCD